MITAKNINEEYVRLNLLSNLVETFQEIATTRMQRIRDDVLKNRVLLNGIEDIYHHVLASYKLSKSQKKSKNPYVPQQKNGKTATVLISANSNLYGSILPKTYQLFIKDIVKQDSDLYIVGSVGKALFENTYNKPFTYIELSDSGYSTDEIKIIRDRLVSYAHVIIYHGLFRSIISQDPIAVDIAGISDQQTTELALIKWIFEPSIEAVLKYFEDQIFSSLLLQNIREAELAKLASRTISLEDARNNIKDAIKKTTLRKIILEHQERNRKQMNNLIGLYYREG